MRVTERAQRAVHHARMEAGRLGHDRVGTEHLLLGLLRDQECLAVATLGRLEIPAETVRRRVEETVGRGPAAHDGYPGHLPTTKAFTLVLGLAGREAMELEGDRLGTEQLLLGLAREGEGVAARVLQELGGGLLPLREAVAAQQAAGVEPEPFPPDRGPPPWEPPPGAELRRVVPLAQEHPLPSGDQLVLISLEVWSDWLDLRYAVVYATPEPEGELPRPDVVGGCEVSDRAGTEYVNWVSSHPSFGMVRVHQRTFVPAPPAGTELLELRFGQPDTRPGEAPPLIVSTVDLLGRP
jgi:Clp amino terminal domain, pathogenicity island component